MFSLFWNLSAALNSYMRFYMPTNRAIDWLRTPRGLKWAIPVAIVATSAYLSAMALCVQLAVLPGLGWLNLLVLLFSWNALKFAVMAPASLAMLIRAWISQRRRWHSDRVVPMGYEPGSQHGSRDHASPNPNFVESAPVTASTNHPTPAVLCLRSVENEPSRQPGWKPARDGEEGRRWRERGCPV